MIWPKIPVVAAMNTAGNRPEVSLQLSGGVPLTRVRMPQSLIQTVQRFQA